MAFHRQSWLLCGALAASSFLGCSTFGGGTGNNSDVDPSAGGSQLGATETDGEDAACAAVSCLEGTHCEVVEVQCVRAPCPPVAQCVPNEDSGVTCANVRCEAGTFCLETPQGPACVPEGTATCAATSCLEGTVCVESREGARCLPADGEPCGDAVCGEGLVCCNASCGICAPPDGVCITIACEQGERPCHLTDCPDGTYCDDVSGEAECLPNPSCDAVRCEEGTHCELQEVQCVRAPCPPVPVCVADATDGCAALDCDNCAIVDGEARCLPAECPHPCAAVLCGPGTVCEATSVECVTEPCCPVAACVPAETPCGDTTCAAGEECCNASCGICTPPGWSCIQTACD